jgi:hypothetical protein
VDTDSREENALRQALHLVRQRLSWRPAAFTVGRRPGYFRENPKRLNDK